ncbi:DUF2771 domain-containing protein [Nocardia camponoti]|uniref:DUF2771 domain-containing protein n=1 Tax=Nocardia camponoti TaxID=1616106 RepID=UPI001E3CF011|nr:DUF2771 domain-containing protein [Nocardia camponoti]
MLALVAAGLAVVVFATAGIVGYAVHKAPKSEPVITAYANGKTIEVAPYLYCTVRMLDCTEGDSATLPVRKGYPVQLSLPDQIVKSPWLIQLIYLRPDNSRADKMIQVDRVLSFVDFPAGVHALTIDSHPEEDLRLAGIEVGLPILIRDSATGQESYMPHAAWSIATPEA